jgi:hypothetical protein
MGDNEPNKPKEYKAFLPVLPKMNYIYAVKMIQTNGLRETANSLGINDDDLKAWLRIGVSTARGNVILAAINRETP